MQLVDYHTREGHRTAIIKLEGRKWIHLLMLGETRARRVKRTEARYFKPLREATARDIRTYNASCRIRGGKRGYAS